MLKDIILSGTKMLRAVQITMLTQGVILYSVEHLSIQYYFLIYGIKYK